MIERILDHPEFPNTRNFSQNIDDRQSVKHASARRHDEVGLPTLNRFQAWERSAARTRRRLQTSDVTGPVADHRHGESVEVGHHNLSRAVRSLLWDLDKHPLSKGVQPPFGALVRHEASITSPILDRNGTAEYRLDGLPLEVEERL